MILPYLSAALFAFLPTVIHGQACITTPFTLDAVEGECGFASLHESFKHFFDEDFNVDNNCDHNATEELLLLLNLGDINEAEEAVKDTTCLQAYTDHHKVLFEDIPGSIIGQDRRDFVQQFYNGWTHWNEEVETIYESEKEERSNYLKEDAYNVYLLYRYGEGSYGITEYPDYLVNFDNCQLNSVYCCWPQDRQARDGNGNCNTPYDTDCVDRDPADNTDLCYVETNEGHIVTGYGSSSEAFLMFPFDDDRTSDNRAEGPIHCHGFAWADDQADISHVFRGNNLFYVSMYDHMLRRGYVRNIQGAPMCGCSEYMPTVSRSDCTEIEIDHMVVTYSYQDGSFGAAINEIDIDFNSCQGKDRYGRQDNNDLWSYMNQLYLDGKISSEKLVSITQKLVGDDPNMCRNAENKFMASKGLIKGFNFDTADWTLLVGREALGEDPFYGKAASTALLTGAYPSSLSATSRALATLDPIIVCRLCASCVDTHQEIFYKRLTPLGDLDLLHDLMYSRSEKQGQIYGDDFYIFSTLQDAHDPSNANAWNCSEYKYSDGFPGDCGPYGRVSSQESLFHYWHMYRPNVAFLTPTRNFELTELESVNVGYNYYKGAVYMDTSNWLYMTASGSDIWGREDSFNSKFDLRLDESDDVTLKVKVESLDYKNSWAKAGLMVRTSMADNAPYFAVLMTGQNGVCTQYRTTTDGWTSNGGSASGLQLNSTWLMLTKRINKYTGYVSADGFVWEEIDYARELLLNDTSIIDENTEWYSGLVLSSHNHDALAEAVYSNYENEIYLWPSSAPSSSPAPTLEISTSMDIGDVSSSFPGSSYHAENIDVWEIQAAGRDIWGSYDGFHFEHYQRSGNVTVIAYLESVDYSDYWAKGGVMIRDSNERGAKNAFVYVSAGEGIRMQVRNTTNGYTDSYREENWDWNVDRHIRSAWLKVEKVGNIVSGYKSQDYVNWGVPIYEQEMKFDNEILEVGLACTSRTNSNYTTCKFRDFEIIPETYEEVSGLISQDIGYVDVMNYPGIAIHDESSNTWEIQASGSRIGSSYDNFHYVYDQVTGNAVIIGHIGSLQTNVSSSSLSGIMIRDSIDRASKMACVMSVAGYGIIMYVRQDAGGSTYSYSYDSSRKDSLNEWLKIEKIGDIVTGYRSTDGSNWELMHQQAVFFNNHVWTAGIAVASSSSSQYVTTVVEGFEITNLGESLEMCQDCVDRCSADGFFTN